MMVSPGGDETLQIEIRRDRSPSNVVPATLKALEAGGWSVAEANGAIGMEFDVYRERDEAHGKVVFQPGPGPLALFPGIQALAWERHRLGGFRGL